MIRILKQIAAGTLGTTLLAWALINIVLYFTQKHELVVAEVRTFPVLGSLYRGVVPNKEFIEWLRKLPEGVQIPDQVRDQIHLMEDSTSIDKLLHELNNIECSYIITIRNVGNKTASHVSINFLSAINYITFVNLSPTTPEGTYEMTPDWSEIKRTNKKFLVGDMSPTDVARVFLFTTETCRDSADIFLNNALDVSVNYDNGVVNVDPWPNMLVIEKFAIEHYVLVLSLFIVANTTILILIIGTTVVIVWRARRRGRSSDLPESRDDAEAVSTDWADEQTG